MGNLNPHLIHGCLGPPKSSTKRHLNRFSSLCMAHYCDRQTDQLTDHTTRSVTIGHIYIRSAVMRPNN